ncbi:adenosine kinase [Bacteroidia bacterium]|nr:adenosine kinase [Bacteroidia bacterium]
MQYLCRNFLYDMKILGIGNALIDVLAKLENDTLLSELNMPKGSMNLIDVHTRNHIFGKIKDKHVKITTGGSIGNTCLALAHLGVPVGFTGKVGDDDYGKYYVREFENAGVSPHFIHVPGNPSGTAMDLITPDGQRTFGTYLGIAAEMQKSELSAEILHQYTHFYVEGYLVQNHELIEGALSLAKTMGLTTALDLASYNIVEAEREFLQRLVDRYVDIVFANEEEAQALTGKPAKEAVEELGNKVEIAVVKTGGKGSWIKANNETIYVPVEEIAPLDTTAAGDYYAAGFFYGLEKKKSLQQCAELGSLLAFEVIQVIGTKLPPETWDKIRAKAQEIIAG